MIYRIILHKNQILWDY